jgi:hypothetical protein
MRPTRPRSCTAQQVKLHPEMKYTHRHQANAISEFLGTTLRYQIVWTFRVNNIDTLPCARLPSPLRLGKIDFPPELSTRRVTIILDTPTRRLVYKTNFPNMCPVEFQF